VMEHKTRWCVLARFLDGARSFFCCLMYLHVRVRTGFVAFFELGEGFLGLTLGFSCVAVVNIVLQLT
jgi:hypothetical protein